jgi:hypothetical protein
MNVMNALSFIHAVTGGYDKPSGTRRESPKDVEGLLLKSTASDVVLK